MQRRNARPRVFLVTIWLVIFASPLLAQGKKPSPTASLPIEPASSDSEFLGTEQIENQARPETLVNPASPPVRRRSEQGSGARELAVQGALLMTRAGFGAQFRFLEFALPWAAVTETIRYFGSDGEESLFKKNYGLMLGLEIHPWRNVRVSPLLNLQAGADHFERTTEPQSISLFGAEAALGVELKLARAASFLFQWVETYYPDLKEPLYAQQKIGDKRSGSFQVFFNLRVTSNM